MGSGQLIWAIAALPAGAVGRRIGLRTALLSGFVLLGVGFGLLLLVEALPRARWVPWLFGCWAVFWIGAALITVNTVPYAILIVDDDGRNAVFPVQGAVIAVMTFAGSLAAGALPGLLVTWIGSSLADAAPCLARSQATATWRNGAPRRPRLSGSVSVQSLALRILDYAACRAVKSHAA